MTSPTRDFAFGPFRLDARSRVLWRDGEVVPLPPRAFDVLEALVERQGEVALKEELLARVWPHAAVEEANLSVNVSLVRRALGEQEDGRPWIETVPRRGYRLLAHAESLGSTERPRSLAILPFQRLGPSDDDDYLGAAIADALITRLAARDDLRVRSMATSLRFAGRDPEEAGRGMTVDGVLTGSLQQSGERLRVTAQLVPLAPGLEPWAGTFEEQLGDLFAVEDAVATQLARSLGLAGENRQTGPGEVAAGIRRSPRPDLEAYQAYMKGRYFWSRLTGESLARAFSCFQEAAEKDPSYAAPHAGLADGHILAGLAGLIPPRQAWDLAETEARAALERDDTVAEAHVSLAYIQLFRDWDFDGAESELERARDLSPHSVAVHQWLAVLLHVRGRPEEASAAIASARLLDPTSVVVHAIEGLRYTLARDAEAGVAHFTSIIELDPNQFVGHWGLGLCLAYAGRYDDAVESLRRSVELAGGLVPLRAALGWGLAAAGRVEESRALLRELECPEDGAWTSPYQRALLHAALGETGRALACLEEACAARDAWAVWLLADPMLDSLRSDPRFEEVTGPLVKRARA
jgi:DNA-binding winged helix-turn-helix (wHTH) protein/tetratricopeptide (TPR) repeat protein